MLSVGKFSDFHTKIVDNKDELDVIGDMFKKAWCVFGRDVSTKFKVGNELAIGDATSFFRVAVHAFVDFGQDKALMISFLVRLYWSMMSCGINLIGSTSM